MKLTVNNYFDDQNGEYICTKFYIDGDECTFEEYEEMLDSLNSFNEDECDGNCDECPNNRFEQEEEPEKLEENQFLRVITDAVNDTLEMFDDPNTCEDCKAHALLDLVMLGVDGALQGCIGRKELLN